MIRSEQQLNRSKAKLDELRKLASAAEDPEDRATWLELAAQIQQEAIEYEAVRDGVLQAFEICSVDDLADAVVKARIAQGLTQKQLAERLGVSEQMVQKDEAGAYEKASLARIADVVDALGYHLQGTMHPGSVRIISTNGPSARSEMKANTVTGAFLPSPTTTVVGSYLSGGVWFGNLASFSESDAPLLLGAEQDDK